MFNNFVPKLVENSNEKKDWSENKNLTPWLIEKYVDKWNWEWLSSNRCLTPEIIGNFKRKWEWSRLSGNPCLTPELIEKYRENLDWFQLSSNLSLTSDLIEKYSDKLKWYVLSTNPCLGIDLLKKYKNKIRWDLALYNPNMTGEFIEEHNLLKLTPDGRQFRDILVSKYVALNAKLSLEFLEKYENIWEWSSFSFNPHLTPEIIEKYKNKWDWLNLASNPCLTLDLIKKYKLLSERKIYFTEGNLTFEESEAYCEVWVQSLLSQNPNLTPEIIENYAHADVWNWETLSYNPCLTPDLIEKYKNKWDRKLLASNDFNLHPIIFERNKKIYTRALATDLDAWFQAYEKKKFTAVLELLKMRIRDLEVGVRKSMI